ncbi:MAG: ATP-binding protein [Magnetococcales bacterium]|nr:ATP-binding protein [Magnetococcales bacterium]
MDRQNPNTILKQNAICINCEMDWFVKVMEKRLKLHADPNSKANQLLCGIDPPELPQMSTPYGDIIRKFSFDAGERLVLILSYIPHLKPQLLDYFFIQNSSTNRRFTEFGGKIGQSHGGVLPTGQSALFLIAGNDLGLRLQFLNLFEPSHPLYSNNILRYNHRHPEEPPLSAILQLSSEYLELLTSGKSYQPPFSSEFPALPITTNYSWNELILEKTTRDEVEDILAWIQHEKLLMDGWKLKKRLKPGYRSLFYGPPGTGKTMTASLLGKTTGLCVYRIDLAKIVSKYIGETEKNLASLFDHAQRKDWILFFDEAESLFSSRTESRSSNDRFANQQTSYLLQRIEDFPGVVLLATNMRAQLDDAMTRRFQSIIHFPMPNEETRLKLWQDNFVDKPYTLASDVDFRQLAKDHTLSGGSIINVLRYACIKAVKRGENELTTRDLLHGVQKEMQKEGKSFKHNT